MMSLDISEDIKVDSTVKLSIKPSYVAIGKGKLGDISYSNQLKAVVDSIKSGKLLSHISLRLEDSTILESVITKESANRLGIKEGDEVTALIKASEVSISELLDI
jgi:molybdopterin-binding protein